MRIIKVSDIEGFARRAAPSRSKASTRTVRSIIDEVRRDGDAAIKRYEKKFSGARLKSIKVTPSEVAGAQNTVTKKQLLAIRLARDSLKKAEMPIKAMLKSYAHNGQARMVRKFVPIGSVGCYIPGGQAKYPSSVVMAVTPAKIAGVKNIIVATPPNPDGRVDPLVITAAKLCGADAVYKAGGAQAIAGMSFGTRSIPQVDKIVGPGGAIVTAAKHLQSDRTAIDMLAGPTELGIIADDSADARLVALDMISQAEHSAEAFCYLITDSEAFARRVDGMIKGSIPGIKRAKLVRSSLQKNGFIAVCQNKDMARLADMLAPEHLEIMARRQARLAKEITNAGLVLIGRHTPSSASDYLLGSNHILPTSRFARARGSLSVLDFLKINTQITATKGSLRKISGHLKALTDAEGLPNHYEAVRARL